MIFWYDCIKINIQQKSKTALYGYEHVLYCIHKNRLYLLKHCRNTRLDIQVMYQTRQDHRLKEKNKKVIGLMTDELGRKILKEFIGLRAKPIVT